MAYYLPPPQYPLSSPPALVAITDQRPHEMRYYQSLDIRAQLKGLLEHSAFAEAPPSAESLRLAEDYINYVVGAGPIPSSVLACDDGGVTMLFASGSFSSVVEIFNNGEIVLATSSGPGETRAVELDRNSQWMLSVATNVGNFPKYS